MHFHVIKRTWSCDINCDVFNIRLGYYVERNILTTNIEHAFRSPPFIPRRYRGGDDTTRWNSSLHCGAKFSYRGRDNYAKRRISCSHALLSTSAFNELTAFNKRAVCKRSEFALRRRHLNACELNRLSESTKATPLHYRPEIFPLFFLNLSLHE